MFSPALRWGLIEARGIKPNIFKIYSFPQLCAGASLKQTGLVADKSPACSFPQLCAGASLKQH